ncbi:hypothetical protein NBH00_05215 [Paraconexibacter antarcticus]|uniref:Uncharacterized protein n=1 Tax=Paraconexibacter antarcticus TaxID=2949664 RepID=A0ABY5DYA4_9ACTN|nr:hypothetical protein [Paraconexibacter antarcticus]UTI65610.1 hypothetical protein NBH00_05215 [Paraconexibacter antarcticus]
MFPPPKKRPAPGADAMPPEGSPAEERNESPAEEHSEQEAGMKAVDVLAGLVSSPKAQLALKIVEQDIMGGGDAGPTHSSPPGFAGAKEQALAAMKAQG